MYVKSVTLKGFKSFASATTLRLEPGITCIVGPNGSGKSNVVDALAWVMGEQGAKSLRGGKMEDVIFAGTAGRAPLGRAEVALTIDNTDGALPIDYTEVTISRTMFRNGGSDYAINGTTCRLLDIQELLSDSGIGREMHVIVGQGQLDTVLRATPEERRGFIEEAAGVLKHRKRKERALRKLEAMDVNLTRVQDLTTEIRRQLGPLGRQAETARKASLIQAEVRDARLRLIADDLVQLTSTLEQEVADETALVARLTEVETAEATITADIAQLEAIAEAQRPLLAAAHDRWFTLTRMVERLGGLASLASERLRLLAEDTTPQHPSTARDPEVLRAQAADLREQHEALVQQIETAAQALAEAVTARTEAERRYAAEQQRLAALARAAADRREGLAKLSGQAAAKASRIEAGEAEIGRLRAAVEQSLARATAAERDFATLEASIAVEEEGEEGLDTAYESAAAHLEALELQAKTLREEELAADRERQAAAARADALAMSVARKDATAVLLAAAETDGVLGSVASMVTVSDGHEGAIAAALGWAADAVVVTSEDAAVRHVATLREQEAGRVGMLLGDAARTDHSDIGVSIPAGATWAHQVVTCDLRVRAAVDHLLAGVVLAADVDVARAAVRSGLTAVTPLGDIYAPGSVRGGSGSAPSVLEIQAAHDEAIALVNSASTARDQARFALAALAPQLESVRADVSAALDRLHDSDARMSAVAERLGALGATVRTARSEAARTEAAVEHALAAVAADRLAHEELVARLAAARSDSADDAEPATDERDALDAAARDARAHETEARLTLRTHEERASALKDRARSLESAAAAETANRQREAARRERRAREAHVAQAVRVAAEYAVRVLRVSADQADLARSEGEVARSERDAQLATARGSLVRVHQELRELTDSVHRDEVARTQQKLRIEALQARAMEEYGVDGQTLVDEFGPDRLIPVLTEPRSGTQPNDQRDDEVPEPVAFVREEQEKRLRSAERKLGALGRVNPLALEEFAALEERHTFLTTQLADLKSSKRDLLDIVKEVDDRVERAFADAFYDTATQFEAVFARLFPGGEGRLILTDPEHMLTTGLEVEARPPGKKIKRLSLLSGGERSLVAVALLVAIFKARPSPFYIMDEVEAALDDANLGRLLTLFEELRDSSQLIVITHQKKTMQIADALYGVTMRGDGVTTVVSQRMKDVTAT
ncbi:MAG: chromosome segregation protein SMC [Dermatophilaceae bacterium]|nr:chromosome segregation protein SMC [Dermatophilaceae bacterium]MBP9917484.1 chromosome segregation protein SMC [Dermatophilaceae bacterium]